MQNCFTSLVILSFIKLFHINKRINKGLKNFIQYRFIKRLTQIKYMYIYGVGWLKNLHKRELMHKMCCTFTHRLNLNDIIFSL